MDRHGDCHSFDVRGICCFEVRLFWDTGSWVWRFHFINELNMALAALELSLFDTWSRCFGEVVCLRRFWAPSAYQICLNDAHKMGRAEFRTCVCFTCVAAVEIILE